MQQGSSETEAVEKDNLKIKRPVKRLEKKPMAENDARWYAVPPKLMKFRGEVPLQSRLVELFDIVSQTQRNTSR